MSSAILDGRMLIGGHRVDAVSGEWFETLDPATGRQLALIARGGGRDVDAAVDSAREAFDRVWSRTAPLKRVQALNRVAALIRERGAALAGHPGINQITFTGSVPTGIAVMKAAADNVVPVTLELGGKSPNIVFADADLERAGSSAARVILQNAGQTCTAPARLLVERRAQAEVVEHAAGVMRAMRLGRGLDNPDMGPVISAPQMERILDFVATGVRQGGRVVAGGERAGEPRLRDGFFVQPTLIDQVAPGTTVEQEEIFGPVLTVTTFETLEEAIAIANGTPYGLVTGIWTRDLHRALTVAAEVKAGQVRINGYSAEGSAHLPFGGFKRSGFGREQGMEAIAAYTQIKNVMINYG